jgi:hypothetical protein
VNEVRLIRKSISRRDVGAALDAESIERALESRNSTEQARRQPDLLAKAPLELPPAQAVSTSESID